MRTLYLLGIALLLSFQTLHSQFATVESATPIDPASIGATCYRLTTTNNYMRGAIWNTTPINLTQNFDVRTKLYFGALDAGADGIAFVFQNSGPSAIGENGGGLGYSKIPGASFIVEFDTWYNNEPWFNVEDPVADHIGFMSNGDPYHNSWAGNALAAPYVLPNIEDGQWHDARFTWNATTKTMAVTILNATYSYTGDIVNNIFGGNPVVYWGFTAANGSVTPNEHKVCILPPVTPSCAQLRTQTPGGWGAPPSGNNPASYMYSRFASAFPLGLTVGLTPNYNIRLTSPQAVTNFLPSGGQAKKLTSNYLNPSGQTLKNTLAGHLVALTLSVRFDQTDASFGAAEIMLGDMVIGSGTFAGWTVSNFLTEANNILGGGTSSYTIQQALMTATAINENYVDGKIDKGYLVCPTTQARTVSGSITAVEKEINVSDNQRYVKAFPTITNGQFTLRFSQMQGTADIVILDMNGRVVQRRVADVNQELQTLPFDLADQASGVYLVRIVMQNNTSVQKVVVQK